VPIAGGLTSMLNYSPTKGDTVNLWDPSANGSGGQNGFIVYVYGKGGWSPSEPVVQLGAGLWLQQGAGATPTWYTNFTVQ